MSKYFYNVYSLRVKLTHTFFRTFCLGVLLFSLFSSPTYSQKLLGTTRQGGANNLGVIYEYDVATSTYTLKYSYQVSGPYAPYGGLIQTDDGKIFGLSNGGGTNGTIYEYDYTNDTVTTKINLSVSLGYSPDLRGFCKASNGKLYAVTYFGGDSSKGSLLEYDPTANTCSNKISFTNATGHSAYAGLMQASNGKLYGTTTAGGDSGKGTLFEYDPTTSTFTKKADLGQNVGGLPWGNLVQASNGKLYASTSEGGTSNRGAIIEYDITNNTLTKKADLFSINVAVNRAGIVLATNGKFYGVSGTGGANNAGLLFEYDPTANTLTKLHDFTVAGGGYSATTLFQASNGKLYGTSNASGANALGALFEYDITTSTYTKKFDFSSADGHTPMYSHVMEPNTVSSYSLTVNSLNGSVIINPDQVSYAPGTEVTLTPTPDAKYYFSGWSGDASGTDNPLTVTMNGNKTITANFDIQPAYLTKYRTAKYEDWATSVDLKGKRAAAKRKFDKNFFEFTIVADSARPLKLDFGMKVTALISRNEVEDDTVLVVNNLAKITDSLLSVMPGETLLVAGTGTMGKKLTAKYSWGKKKAVSLKADSLYELNIKGLPMPNLINVGEELFPKGFGNTVSYYPKTGLVMGIPQGLKKANSMVLKKYADVLTTLAKKVKTGYIFDTANVRCLDTLKKKPIAKQLAATGPDKYQNKLLAEALALKLNIAASMTEKFPVGLGELLYNNMDDPTNSFNSSMVSTISSYADSMLSCLTLSSKPTATLNELYTVLRNINVAFADSPYTIDTLSFGSKTQLKGLRELFDVEYLLSNVGIAPKTFAGNSESSNETPEAFALNQNYPNPFNPTTTLSFVIGSSSLVTLKVYNTLGQEVATLLNNENVETGMHEVSFDGGNLASGVYFYRLTTQSFDDNGIQSTFTDVKRMILIK